LKHYSISRSLQVLEHLQQGQHQRKESYRHEGSKKNLLRSLQVVDRLAVFVKLQEATQEHLA